MNPAQTPRVIVVGAGAWGRNHVRTFHQLGALAGVVELSPTLQEKVRAEYPGVPVWSDLAQALPHADGAVIATPAPTHKELASLVLKSGKGVLVEKPMTLDAGEADELVALAKETGRPLMVGHLLLYQPAVQELKRLLDRGLVGRVHRIHMERLNHGRVRATENALWSLAPHDVAVLLYLMSEAPARVQAFGAAFLQPVLHDDVHMELGFPSGRTAHIHSGWYWPGKQRGLKVLGEKGMVVFDESDQSLTYHRKWVSGGLAPEDEGSEVLFRGSGEPLRLEAQHFLDCLATGRQPISDGPSGLDVTRVLQQAHAQLLAGLEQASETLMEIS